jgi:hypothetical protein
MLTRQSELQTEHRISVATSSPLEQERCESNQSQTQEFIILAPLRGENASDLGRVTIDSELHGKLLADVQRLRGWIYSEDGAIDPGNAVGGWPA